MVVLCVALMSVSQPASPPPPAVRANFARCRQHPRTSDHPPPPSFRSLLRHVGEETKTKMLCRKLGGLGSSCSKITYGRPCREMGKSKMRASRDMCAPPHPVFIRCIAYQADRKEFQNNSEAEGEGRGEQKTGRETRVPSVPCPRGGRHRLAAMFFAPIFIPQSISKVSPECSPSVFLFWV